MTTTQSHELLEGMLTLRVEHKIGFPIFRQRLIESSMMGESVLYHKLSLADSGMVLVETVRSGQFYESQEIHHKWLNWDFYVNHLSFCFEDSFNEAREWILRNDPKKHIRLEPMTSDYDVKTNSIPGKIRPVNQNKIL